MYPGCIRAVSGMYPACVSYHLFLVVIVRVVPAYLSDTVQLRHHQTREPLSSYHRVCLRTLIRTCSVGERSGSEWVWSGLLRRSHPTLPVSGVGQTVG